MKKAYILLSGAIVAIIATTVMVTVLAFKANPPNSTIRYCIPDSSQSGYYCAKTPIVWKPADKSQLR